MKPDAPNSKNVIIHFVPICENIFSCSVSIGSYVFYWLRGELLMNILLTNPSSRLSRELAQYLGSSHEVELSAGPFGHE